MKLRNQARPGYVIFAVLIVIVVLSLVAYRFTDSMTAEYRAGVRMGDDAQARAAAISGLHYAAAVLSDRTTFYEELGGNPYDNPDIFEQFEVIAAGTSPAKRSFFSIRAVAMNDQGGFEQRFGVIDEGGKLNINSLIMLDPTGQQLYSALMQLPGMTEDVADAIVDWVDADDDARPAGAESSYYLSLPNPCMAKNGPLNSLDELLLVRGVAPELLYGGDRNRNGIQDEGELDDSRGWSDYLTVYGRELNVDMSGIARIYVNGDDLDLIYRQLEQAVGAELATYVVASKLFNARRIPTTTATLVTGGTDDGGRVQVTINFAQPKGNNQRPVIAATTEQLYALVQERIATTGSSGRRIRSLTDLVDTQITLPRPPGTPNDAPDLVAYSPLSDPAKRNQLLPLLLDKATTRQAIELVPRINVNTAPREVLLGISNRNGEPVLTEAEVDAILGQRASQVPTDPATVTAAWLVTANVIPASRFRSLERYITGGTMVYRVQAIGYFDTSGPMARYEAVIDTNQGAPRFLHIRDLSDLDNPRGFQPPVVSNE